MKPLVAMRKHTLLLAYLLLLALPALQGQELSGLHNGGIRGAWEIKSLHRYFRFRGKFLGETYVSHRLTFHDSLLVRTLTCIEAQHEDTLFRKTVVCTYSLRGDTLIMRNLPAAKRPFYQPYSPYNVYDSEESYYPYFPSATVRIRDDRLFMTYSQGTARLDEKLIRAYQHEPFFVQPDRASALESTESMQPNGEGQLDIQVTYARVVDM